jgi:hypothetical protein
MNVLDVRLEGIDFADETYRISEELTCAALQDSLREIGQLNPVVLMEKSESPALIVCGFRRLSALRRMGRSHCLARFLPQDAGGPLAAFRIGLWDNLAHRQLNSLEKARVVHTLKHTCAVDHEVLVATYLPLLGLEAHKKVLISYLRLHQLSPMLKSFLGEGRLTIASAEHLAALNRSGQDAWTPVFDRSRFSASLQRRLLDLVDDLAAIGECGVETVVGSSEIAEALNDSNATPFQRGEAVMKILHRRRNPHLSEAEECFRIERSRLSLPGTVKLTPDPFFERPRIRVEFEVPSAESFRETADALQRAAGESALEAIFRVR